MPDNESSQQVRRRKKSARFLEIAEKAGVSQSTVDRVLNERGSVSPSARGRVLAAARSLRVPRILPEPWHGKLNVEVILPRNPTPFWQRLDDSVRSAARQLPRHMSVHRSFIPENDEKALIAAILKPVTPRAGLVIAAEITPEIHASLASVLAKGVHVVTMASDVPDLLNHIYCGIDNYAAGRTAGLLMATAIKGHGKVLVLRANDWLDAHRDRTEGFVSAMREYAPPVELKIAVTRERMPVAAGALLHELKDGKLLGVYDTGWVSTAIAQVLRHSAARPVWIGHELDPDHRSLIIEGLLSFVLDQDPLGQANAALSHMAKKLGVIDLSLYIAKPQVRFYCRENLPEVA
jgi:LacI family transcriptional regulator